MSGCELVEVRNVADAVGLVLSKRSDTMRRQARKRYLQVVERIGGPGVVERIGGPEVVERIGGPGRDRTDDLFHAMEARSQLRHRPTLVGSTTSILAHTYGIVKLRSAHSSSGEEPAMGRAIVAKAAKIGILGRYENKYERCQTDSTFRMPAFRVGHFRTGARELWRSRLLCVGF